MINRGILHRFCERDIPPPIARISDVAIFSVSGKDARGGMRDDFTSRG